MKNKALYALMIVLSLVLAIQYYWLKKIPALDQSLIRHESSHYRLVSLFEKNSFYKTFEKLEAHAKRSARPKTKSAYEAAFQTEQSLPQVLALLHMSHRYGSNDTVNSYIMKAVEIHNQNLTLVKPHTARAYQFMALDEQALDEDYLTMDVSRRESQFLQNYVLAMDLYYDACCDAITDEFYGPGLLMSNIGYKHFPDTVNISMPSAMKAGVKERVEVTLNKKYFNKMIDSLKNAGVLNFESRPFYKGIVKLESDDLVIEKLNNDRQVISELDYTTWRFDISSSETGVKKMKGSVGLIVLDSSDKEKVIYIPLRLRAIEAL